MNAPLGCIFRGISRNPRKTSKPLTLSSHQTLRFFEVDLSKTSNSYWGRYLLFHFFQIKSDTNISRKESSFSKVWTHFLFQRQIFFSGEECFRIVVLLVVKQILTCTCRNFVRTGATGVPGNHNFLRLYVETVLRGYVY